MEVDGRPIDVDTRKAIALLAYLTVEGAASRDTVATLLWAESSTDRARATLRRTLSSLRAGIGADFIAADRNRIALAGDIQADITVFQRSLAATTDHEHVTGDVCASCIPLLTRATILYRGDFLEGFSVRDAPEFEDWARTVGESLRLKAGEAFNRLAMALAAEGDYPGAIESVSRWIELDGLHEPAHRLLMLLNAWAGDRPGAVDAYRSFVAILDQELGVPPLEETTELYEAILDEDLPPAPGVRRRIRAHPPSRPTDSGTLDRETELEELGAAIESSRVTGQICVVSGPAWMGKTRLVEDAITAFTEGRQVLLGRAFRMEQGIPYGVATQILRSLTPSIVSHPGIPEWSRAEVGRLVPQPGEGRPPVETDRYGELRLLEAVHEMVTTVSRTEPLVIVVDDLQWIDPASAGIVAYLARRIADLRVALILVTRSGEQLPDTVADIVAEAAVSIDLGPLTAADIATHVADTARAESIVGQTGGVPLLVLEALAVGGPISEESSGVMRYMKARQQEIGELAKQVLATASVLAGVCDASLLRDVSGRTEEEVVDAVEELIGARLLRELPDGDGLSFTLDRLEKITYDAISLTRRRLLHGRAADALSSRPRSATDPRLASAIAAQYRGAGDPRAAQWYRTAGDLARDIYAHTEARDFYETAIALGNPDVGLLRLALGELALAAGDYQAALRELTAAAAQGEGATLGLIEHRLGLVQRHLGRFTLAIEHFETSAPLHPEPSYLTADWALLYKRRGDDHAALSMGEQAVAAAEKTGNTQMLSRALNVLGVVTDDPGKVMVYLDKALELAGDNDVLRMAALNNKALTLSRIGNPDAAVRLVLEAIEIASRTGHVHREAALLNHLADLHHHGGRAEMAQQALTDAVTLFADIDAGEFEPEVWLLSRW